MKLSKKSEKLLKELIEIRFVKSQKKGWVAIVQGDRDWDSGISEDEMFKKLNSMAPPQINMDNFPISKIYFNQKNWAKDHIKFMNKNRGI